MCRFPTVILELILTYTPEECLELFDDALDKNNEFKVTYLSIVKKEEMDIFAVFYKQEDNAENYEWLLQNGLRPSWVYVDQRKVILGTSIFRLLLQYDILRKGDIRDLFFMCIRNKHAFQNTTFLDKLWNLHVLTWHDVHKSVFESNVITRQDTIGLNWYRSRQILTDLDLQNEFQLFCQGEFYDTMSFLLDECPFLSSVHLDNPSPTLKEWLTIRNITIEHYNKRQKIE